MDESKLTIEQDFLVKESQSINYIAGAALLVVFFVSMSFGITAGEITWSP
jgi:hypothetical protein